MDWINPTGGEEGSLVHRQDIQAEEPGEHWCRDSKTPTSEAGASDRRRMPAHTTNEQAPEGSSTISAEAGAAGLLPVRRLDADHGLVSLVAMIRFHRHSKENVFVKAGCGKTARPV